jgi:hypothetical protein
MAVIQINRNPGRRELKQFGFVWLGFVLLFALLAWLKWRSPSLSGALVAAAVLVPIVGWTVPSFMRLVFVGLSFVAFPIGWTVSHVLLVIVYFAVMMPIGLAMRLLGHDPMERKSTLAARSYWKQRPAGENVKLSRYFRQF